ncbi:MAG: phage tail protein [Spirochaetota bacterium]
MTTISTLDTTIQNTVPPGTIVSYAMQTAPIGYLSCDGSAVSRTTYANLFAVIGTNWGAGDGSTTFNLPDVRAAMPVGVGTSSRFAQNESRSIASYRNDQFQGHAHTVFRSVLNFGGGGAQSGQASAGSDSANVHTGNFLPYASNGTPRVGTITHGKSLL